MLKRLLLAALIALGGLTAAKAQVYQSGNVTVGHCAYWVTTGVIGDCGGPTNGALTGLGVTLNGGTAIGILSAPTTSSGWNALNFSSTTSGNQVISTQNFGTATAGSLVFNVNGTAISFGNGSGTAGSGWLSPILDQQFGSTIGGMLARASTGWSFLPPGSSGQYLQSNGSSGIPSFTATAPASGTFRAVSSGSSDTASTADGTVGWNSATTSVKAETIYTCNSSVLSRTLSITDEKGTAATYPIVVTPSSGTVQNASSYTINQNFGTTIFQCDGGSNWVVVSGQPSIPLRGYLGGLTLSNDGTSPNTVLDVSAGTATDSTNAVLIALGTFTKSTAGAWAAGSGGNGMGVTLTITATTWYHVCLIVNASLSDVYFDTDAACTTHSPGGTTARRRLGSFLTDGSSHILAFVQQGDYFEWGTPPAADINSTNPGTSAVTSALTVPLGVNVRAALDLLISTAASGVTSIVYFSDLSTVDVAPATTSPLGQINVTAAAGPVNGVGNAVIRTNTSQQIRYRANQSDSNFIVRAVVTGWYDDRGRVN